MMSASLVPLFGFAQQRPDDAAAVAAGIMAFGCLFWAFLVLLLAVFPIFCFWRIFSKAGYSGALALLCLIPGVGILVVLCILAFSSWPNEKK